MERDMEYELEKLREKYPYGINEYTESNEVIIKVGENYQHVKAEKILIHRPTTLTLCVHRFEGKVECSSLYWKIPERYKHLPVLFWSI